DVVVVVVGDVDAVHGPRTFVLFNLDRPAADLRDEYRLARGDLLDDGPGRSHYDRLSGDDSDKSIALNDLGRRGDRHGRNDNGGERRKADHAADIAGRRQVTHHVRREPG